ncbi:hypothetical protein ACLOJK_021125 [Asimina triloba]
MPRRRFDELEITVSGLKETLFKIEPLLKREKEKEEGTCLFASGTVESGISIRSYFERNSEKEDIRHQPPLFNFSGMAPSTEKTEFAQISAAGYGKTAH